MRRLAILSVLVISCSTGGGVRDTFYHNPLTSSNWHALSPREISSSYSQSDSRDERLSDENIREKMVFEAKNLLSRGGGDAGFGAEDLSSILKNARVQLRWSSSQGLEALVKMGKKNGAYQTDGKPKPGDIALFHNQTDANGNGELDDWLTGCGVVTGRDGPVFEAVVRTGNEPRQVVVWPDGPARRTADGKKVNSYMRIPSRSDPRNADYLAGRLYAGYLDIERLANSASD